jgi:hypothetical protein
LRLARPFPPRTTVRIATCHIAGSSETPGWRNHRPISMLEVRVRQITTREHVERRLRELLTGLKADEREQVITESTARYEIPSMRRAQWRLVDGMTRVEAPPRSCSSVERGLDGEEIYWSCIPGHANRARTIANALNQIEAENVPLPGEPLGASA